MSSISSVDRLSLMNLVRNILESYPKLADKRDEKGIKALDLLASKPLSFRSGSSYTLKNLGSTPFIPYQILGVLVYSCIPSMVIDSEIVGDVEDPRGSAHDVSKSEGTLLSKLMVQKDHQGFVALSLQLCVVRRYWNKNKKNRVVDPLILATKHGIHEMVEEILEKFPNVATTFDENGRNILHMATSSLKDRILYDYLRKI
ncbi:hypothetical protein LOK49_LG07G02186 [Camellia lanceoleosa]|uniref:Uncharacterized protein n=1 Tax=Camellia lanceoleosa TaxID=1840588 RepID=A0ACC0GY40_9ERIC|nr:hypothetical protein LOK49_LG07G02186 [Camellia lanceoleosa]